MSELTDAELNLAIARLVYPDAQENALGQLFYQKNKFQRLPIVKDYCNNWNALMPLVIEHEMQFEGGRGAWAAGKWFGVEEPYIHICRRDPQRALAECLLKVLESKDE